MLESVKTIRVFVSSPSDLGPERELLEHVVARVSAVWRVHVEFELVRWERAYYQAGESFQDAIDRMGSFDLLIGLLWKRIGSPLPPSRFKKLDGTSFESGTIYEIESALASWELSGSPKVYVFRKTVPVTFEAASVDEERTQYVSLMRWWNATMRDEQGHYLRGYQKFLSSEDLELKIEDLLERYARDLDVIPHGPAWDIDSKGSPYPGLLAYDQDYSPVFFGRSLSVSAAREELLRAAERGCPALFIVGPSGSGKSSLARAGILPTIAIPGLASVDAWRSVTLEPTPDLVMGLSVRLYRPGALPELAQSPCKTPDSLVLLLRASPESAVETVRWAINHARALEQRATALPKLPELRLILLFDQLETLIDSPDADAVSCFLAGLVKNGMAWLVSTFRSDRYASFQLVPALAELRRCGALFDLPPPGPSEVSEIIRGPALAAGLEFQSRDGVTLASHISKSLIGADSLPLLQMTLSRLFTNRSGNTLTFDAYTSMGGIEGAIAAHAEQVFRTVSTSGLLQIDTLFRLLVSDVDDRGRLSLRTLRSDQVAPDTPLDELISVFTEFRLLVRTDLEIRLSHEALLRNWDRAVTSPAMQPEAIRLRRQIELSFRDWLNSGSSADLLQPGTVALSVAERIVRDYPGAFPPEIDDFVLTSARAAKARADAIAAQAEIEARRSRFVRILTTGAAVVFAVLAGVAGYSYLIANKNLMLAVLTRSEQHLMNLQPAHAAALIHNLRPASILGRLGDFFMTEEDIIRLQTISEITSASAVAPLRSWKFTAPVTSIALSVDGKRLAVGLDNGCIVLLLMSKSGPQQNLVAHTSGRVDNIEFSRDGSKMASFTSKEVIYWNLDDGAHQSFQDGDDNITAAALDPQGQFLSWATKDGRVVMIDIVTGGRNDWKEHPGWTTAISYSSDGSSFASAGGDGIVKVRRRGTGPIWSEPKPLETGIKDLISIRFSLEQDRIAGAGLSGFAGLWMLDRPDLVPVTLRIPAQKRYRIDFSADGSLLALASWDGTVHLFRSKSLYPDRESVFAGTIDSADSRINGLRFAASQPTHLFTASESGAVKLWDVLEVRPALSAYNDDSVETQFGRYSPDGKSFVTGGRDGFARLYSVSDGGELSLVCKISHANWVIYASFSPNSERVSSVGLNGSNGKNSPLKMWDRTSCNPVANLEDIQLGFIGAVEFRPNGRAIAWGGADGAVYERSLDANGSVRALGRARERHRATITELAYTRDGKYIASGARDGRVIVWNTEADTSNELLPGGPPIETVQVSSGGLVAAGGTENRIHVWDLARGGTLVASLHIEGGAYRLAFNGDGTRLAVGTTQRAIYEWRVSDWNKTRQLSLNTMVGLRSVFGYRPKTDDLAFDGESGIVRILRHPSAEPQITDYGVSAGVGTFFDKSPSNLERASPVGELKSEGVCARPALVSC